MKSSFKTGALALVIAVSFAACKGKGTAGSADSDTTRMADTSKMDNMTDTTKADTTTKVDTTGKVSADTTKKK